MPIFEELPVFTIADLEELTGLDTDLFDNDHGVLLGVIAVGVIQDWNLNLAVQVLLGDELVFRANLGSTGSGNDPWLAGKAAVATAFNEPSLLVRRRQEAAGTTLEEQGYDFETYRAHGGSLPIRIDGLVVGTITMSGEPDVIDHAASAEAVRRYLAR